ncbi:MAG: HDOD domain-containing protein [Candidatus Hydrogenedens sp.]|nr:HDOD domain-containing protein [Candidatus Hydrogenedens sp.]
MSACPHCENPVPKDITFGEKVQIYGCPHCYNPVAIKWENGKAATSALAKVPDVRQSAPEGSIGEAILKALPKAIDALPVIPEIAQRVMKLVSDPDVTMKDLSNVIQEDQTIALSIMKLANSPIYGGLEEIKELNAACARLGMRNIANTVQAVANNNLFITGDQRLQAIMRKLWTHSVATAHCANEIAQVTSAPFPEMLFLAGLLHNMGKVVLIDIVSGQYTGAIGELRATPQVFKQVIDSFHPLLGLHVAQAWRLPPEYLATTFFQNRPNDCPRDEWLPMVHVVALASLIATLEGYGLNKVEETFLTTNSSTRYLNLNDIKLAALRVDLSDKLEALLQSIPQPAGN